jgi:hypothetical protein
MLNDALNANVCDKVLAEIWRDIGPGTPEVNRFHVDARGVCCLSLIIANSARSKF